MGLQTKHGKTSGGKSPWGHLVVHKLQKENLEPLIRINQPELTVGSEKEKMLISKSVSYVKIR